MMTCYTATLCFAWVYFDNRLTLKIAFIIALAWLKFHNRGEIRFWLSSGDVQLHFYARCLCRVYGLVKNPLHCALFA